MERTIGGRRLPLWNYGSKIYMKGPRAIRNDAATLLERQGKGMKFGALRSFTPVKSYRFGIFNAGASENIQGTAHRSIKTVITQFFNAVEVV